MICRSSILSAITAVSSPNVMWFMITMLTPSVLSLSAFLNISCEYTHWTIVVTARSFAWLLFEFLLALFHYHLPTFIHRWKHKEKTFDHLLSEWDADSNSCFGSSIINDGEVASLQLNYMWRSSHMSFISISKNMEHN